MNSQGGILKIIGLPPRKEFDHVLQIDESIVDRRRRQHEESLPLRDIRQFPVMRPEFPFLAFDAWIAEVMSLVNDDDIRQFLRPLQTARILASA